MSVAAEGKAAVAGVTLTHPDKVLYAEQGITKQDLADYYMAVADRMLAHVAQRPLTLVRCPAGSEKKCFYQRHAGSGVPDQLGEVKIAGFAEPYLYIKDASGLVALVQMGVLEIHPWGARIDRPDRPDRIVFDLDPGDGLAFADVAQAAQEVRARLEAQGLAAFAKTTGGKGMHVVVPIARRHTWQAVKAFAKATAEAMAADAPRRFLTRIAKAERAGRIFVDYLRNDPTATAIGPYSTRARAGAPVALPVAWDEVTPTLDPTAFTVASVPRRIAEARDPWADIAKHAPALPR
jgi:bifunctional non-homologous end joining protein LigD